ncbi:hypothetical protein ACQEVM_13315 [Streptomyces sp. CA-243310]|uniref:hypothetical protein n=1 Tax=Streptomyces sp. CA-243310 TaxID=3240056 RepID=UPI003D8D0BD5
MTAALTPADPAAYRDELADPLVAVVAGGPSLGFLAGRDRAGAAAWWDGLLPAVEDGPLARWIFRDGADGPVDGTVGWYRESKDRGRHDPRPRHRPARPVPPPTLFCKHPQG